MSIEISMYPLQDGYLEKIDAFLLDLNQRADACDDDNSVEIRSSNMSTRLFGNYQQVTSMLNAAIEKSMREHGKLVFVSKILSGDSRELAGYD